MSDRYLEMENLIIQKDKHIAELKETIRKQKMRETTFDKPETPGQYLDQYLIGTRISFEDALGIMQVIFIHTSNEDYRKIQASLGV